MNEPANEIKKNSVLVVDDENANITALTLILKADYVVYATKNGRDAVKTAEKYLPDVILLDILMPEMDGYAVIAALKSSERTREIPVVFITGLDDAGDEEKGLSLGAADYITKPFSPAVVRLRVENQIKILGRLRAVQREMMQYKQTQSLGEPSAAPATDLKATREALEHRESMLGALNKTAVLFLSQSKETWEETMVESARLIAGAARLDRISVWRNVVKPDGLHTGQIFLWDKASGDVSAPDKSLEDLLYARFAPRLEKLFTAGESINGPARLLTEATALKSLGVVSAFGAPIFIRGAFWGFALYEDRVNERWFDDSSVGVMRSVAFLCADAVERAKPR